MSIFNKTAYTFLLLLCSSQSFADCVSTFIYHPVCGGGASIEFSTHDQWAYGGDIGTKYMVCREDSKFHCVDWSDEGEWLLAVPKDRSTESWSYRSSEFRRIRRISSTTKEISLEIDVIVATSTENKSVDTFFYSYEVGLLA